jgi:hypothetical protein
LPSSIKTAEEFCGGLVKICTETIGRLYTNVKVFTPSTNEYVPIVIKQDNGYYGCPGAPPLKLNIEDASIQILQCQDRYGSIIPASGLDKETKQWLEKNQPGEKHGDLRFWGKSGSTFALHQKAGIDYLYPVSFWSNYALKNQPAKEYCEKLVKMCANPDGTSYPYVGVIKKRREGRDRDSFFDEPESLTTISIMEDGKSYLCPYYGSQFVSS